MKKLSRRTFFETVAAAGGSVALSSCESRAGGADPDAQAPPPWVKDPSPFIRHPTNLETRLEQIHGILTPNDLFFVRNHAPTPLVDPTSFRLVVEGDAVERRIEFTYEDLLKLPTASTISYLECAGNWRGFYQTVLGQVASGGQWQTGAVGCASWSGVSLGSVLEVAGVRSNAVDVNLFGLDDGAFNRPMTLEKALDSDTLLAFSMNGEVLPADHGYPVRGVVPGWAGSNSVKWVGRVVVSLEKQWVKNNTTSYVLVGPEWPAADYAPADGGPITTLNVKSALALPWPAALSVGAQRIRGFAYSPHGRIRQVEWSVDDGGWRAARLVDPILSRAWARFELEWDAARGDHVVRVRATDDQGNAQPDSQPFNEKGYLLNVPLPHPVRVA